MRTLKNHWDGSRSKPKKRADIAGRIKSGKSGRLEMLRINTANEATTAASYKT